MKELCPGCQGRALREALLEVVLHGFHVVIGGGLDILDAARIDLAKALDDVLEHRIGGRVMHYILRAGFKGEIYPVNPGREVVQGVKAYPRIEDIPGTADCAVLAIPAAAVIDALRSCATKGVKAAVLFSAGFA